MPSFSDLARGGISRALSALAQVADPVSKAGAQDTRAGSDPGAPGPEVNKAPVQKADEDPKSLLWDPFTVLEQLGFKDRPSPVTFGTLRAIYYRLPIISDIIKLRVDQIASFAYPQRSRYDIGFRLKLRDSSASPSPADRKFIHQLETMIMQTGATDQARGRSNFESYLRKVAFDSLLYDQDCTEVVPNRKGQPAEFYAVDATSIRLADSARLHMDEDVDDQVRYVQIYDNAVVTEYTQNEMIFGVRNPSTNMKTHGYGESELERLVNAITGLLYAWDYNQSFFSQGSVAKGILNFKGAMPEKQLSSFKRQWYSMVSGVENAWKTPVINTPEGTDLAWIALQQSNKEMEFSAWMDFLIKVCAAAYAMDPAEINFKYGDAGGKASLSEDSNRDKVIESRERGLRPLLRHFANNLNHHIIWPIDPAFELEFVGLDSMTRTEVADLNMKRGKSYLTINELRAEDNLEPLPKGQGDIILDPTFIGYLSTQGGGMAPGGQPPFGAPPGDPSVGAPATDVTEDDDEAQTDDPDADGASDSDQGDGPDDVTAKSLRKAVHLDLRL